MASANFLRTTERHDSAAVLSNYVRENVSCIVRVVTVLVKRPAIGKGLFHLVVHFELTACNNGGRAVEEERIGISGHRNCKRIRSDHSESTEGRNHDSFTVSSGETDKSCITCHLCIVACNTVVVGVTYGNDTDTGSLCLLDSLLHSSVTCELTHSIVRINYSTYGSFEYDLRLSVDVDDSLFDTLVVAYNSLHSVRLDTVEVAHEKNVCDYTALISRKSDLRKSIGAKAVEQFD